MSYASADTSVQSGRPIELYRFAHGGNVYLYNSGSVPISYLGDVYAPAAIERGKIEASQEFGKSYLDVRMPYDNAVAQLFAGGYPDGHVTLAVYRSHIGETEWITHWRGRVASVGFVGHECELRAEPVFTTLQRAGLRAVYQLQCRHVLYSGGGVRCQAAKATHSVAGTVSTFVANQIFVTAASAWPDDWFTGGALETPHGSRMIIAHAGSSLTLAAAIPDLAAGEAVTLVAGCDHTGATCTAKFANDINYGGFRWLPQKNPFTGGPVV